jgi:cephalosporin-C deacetylase-like acetyl esterase
MLIAGAQDLYKVLDWKTRTSLREYLLQNMHQQYDLRRETLAAALMTTDGINEYIEGCRQRYLRLLGEMPTRTLLNAVVTKHITRDGYSVENVIYESRPGHHVTSNLYLPEGRGPFPAVIFFCGHEMTSKATESYQKTAILFVENGFAVLVVDPISQGERVQFTEDGRRILRGSTTEHTLLNAGANITGTSVAAWELFDNVRSLDYLVSRPEIDRDRLGCLGNSGGGAQTTWFIGFDDRVKAAAPCSFITSREREYELNGTGDGCQQIPFEGREQLEIADYLMIFAPKPLLILAGRYDFVDYAGTEDTYRELSGVYRVMGEAEKIALFTGDDGHGISAPKREAAVRWFRKWLCNDTTIIHEADSKILNEEETWCTPSGQVTACYNDEVTVQATNLKRIDKLDDARKKFMAQNNGMAVQARLCELLALDNSNPVISTEIVSSEKHNTYILKKVIIRSRGEMPLPCLVYIPDKESKRDTLIVCLDYRGKSVAVADSVFISNCLDRGDVLVFADLRGMGETAEEPQANDPKYYNIEYHNAILSLHTGRPLPGQRVKDIDMLLEYICSDDGMRYFPVKVYASGVAALPALLAALLDRRITALELTHTIKSFAEITERPMDKDWYSYVIPGILRFFDLSDLVALRPDMEVKYLDLLEDEN